MPIDELKEVYDKYKEETQTVVKDKDTFFDFMKGLSADANDKMFDSGANLKTSNEEIRDDFNKDDFFSAFELSPKADPVIEPVKPTIEVENKQDGLKTEEIKNKKIRSQF